MEQQKNPMQKVKYFLFGILTISIIVIVFNVFRQNIDIQAETKNTTINNLLQEQYYKELSLNLPDVIDTQNLEIIFANPKNDSKKYPITIIIDNKKFEKAKSPFKLPDLEIGTHTITIKYTNKDGIPRTLTTLITIVPKAPILNQKNKTLFYRPEPITISGKALAFSKIMVIINSTDIQYIPVDSTGEWQFTIKSPKTGTYNLLFFTYKNGVISKNYSKIQVKYNLQQTSLNNQPIQKNNTSPVTNIIKSIKKITENKNYLYMVLGITISAILVYFIIQAKKWLRRRWEQKEIIDLIKRQKPKKNIVKIIKRVEEKQFKTMGKTKKENSTKLKHLSTKNKKTRKSANKQTSSKKDKTKKSKNKTELKKTKSQKVSIQKKVLSKEEFLSMFKKTKNKG